MYIPDYLFFKHSRYKEKLITRFTGKIDVNAALQGNPRCWREPVTAGTKDKKTIVINDFRLGGMSLEETRRFKHFIDKLIDEGFSIYLWQENGPVELNESNTGILYLPLVRGSCTPAHPQMITNAMQKKNVTSKGLIIMDIAALENLENEIEKETTLEKPKNVVNIKNIIDSEYTYENIKKMIPDITLTVPPLDDKTQPILEDWYKKYNDNVSIDYQHYVIDSKEKELLYPSIADKVKTVELKLDGVALGQVLKKGVNLEKIIFDCGVNFDVDHGPEQYPKIVEVEIGNLTAVKNRQNVELFFNKLTNLKKFKVHDGGPLNENMLRDPLGEKLIVDSLSITNDSPIQKIADNPTRLHTNETHYFNISLDKIASCLHKVITDKLELINVSLDANSNLNSFPPAPFIKTLKIQSSSNAAIDATLKLTPNIDSLFISQLNENFSESFQKNRLEKLASLNISGYNTERIVLKYLKNFSPNLSSLTLNARASISEDTLPLKSLKEIKIKDHMNLTFLSKFAPDIESLNIESISKELLQNDLPKLRSLSAEYSGDIKIVDVLNKYPTLENLSLNYGVDFGTGILPQALNLKKLTARSKINIEAVAKILKHSPNLNELNLINGDNYTELLQQLSKEGVRLTHLRKVDFSCYVNFKNEDYQLLKQLAPNLKSLTIKGNTIDQESEDDVKIVMDKKVENLTSNQDKKINGQNKHASSKKVDSDLSFNNSNFNIPKVFSNISDKTTPPARMYRNSVFNAIQLMADSTNPFLLMNEGDLGLETYNNFQYGAGSLQHFRDDLTLANKKDMFQGKHKMRLTELFMPLPSLTPNEIMHALHIEGLSQNDIEVKYSTRDNLYYIRQKGVIPKEVTIDYIIETPAPQVIHNEELKNFVDLFLQFGVSKDKIDLSNLSAAEKLDKIFELKVGRCEHRALVFKHIAQNKFPNLPVRIVENDCHSFVEVYQENQWIIYDLGGYPANVNEFDPDKKNQVTLEKTFKSEISEKHKDITKNEKNTHNTVETLDITEKSKNSEENIEKIENIENNVMKKKKEASLNPQHITWEKSKGNAFARIKKAFAEEDFEALQMPEYEEEFLTYEELKHLPDAFESPDIETLSQVNIYRKIQMESLGVLHPTKDSATGNLQGKNVLVQCESDEDVALMCLNIQSLARHTQRPIFVINSPEQIVCASDWLRREQDNTGTRMPGPGGPLHDFLTQTYIETEKPILIVNWNNFTADELVKFNSLIDKERFADNTPIPSKMTVVGLYNINKPDAYKGSDFHSRNNEKLSVPYHSLPVETFESKVPFNNKLSDALQIELYNSVNWKELLLGQWILEAGKTRFVEGPLALALKEGKDVHFSNAPWENAEFKQFMQEAKIHGKIHSQDEILEIPELFWENVTQSQGYDWSNYFKGHYFITDANIPMEPFAVNSETFKQFIDHYNIKDGQAQASSSLFKQYEGMAIELLITEPLIEEYWVQLFKEANKWDIMLFIGVPENLRLPDSLEKEIKVERLKNKVPSFPQVELIDSEDVSYSLEIIKERYKESKPCVIDISEFDSTDIFYNVNSTIEVGNLSFAEQYSDIWNRLKNGETVILKGKFKEDLANTCMNICTKGGLYINDVFEPIKGKLILLSNKPLSPAFQSHHEAPQLKAKLNLILEKSSYSEDFKNKLYSHPWAKDVTLSQIKAAIYHYQHSNPPTFDFNEALYKITSTAKPIQQVDLSEGHINTVCDRFVSKRFNAIKNIFSYAPFAFIGGKTGVGKSSFVKKYFTEENGYILYNEMQDLDKFVNDKTKGKVKVLFLDEANISDHDYAIFEGLYEIPPRILIDKKLVILDPPEDYKILLAGNPMSYGGERHLPNLLKEHGNACIFDIMPNEYIYKEILKPIFEKEQLQKDEIEKISECILNTYQYICSISQEEILISPRELKMMAMMIISSPQHKKMYTNAIYDVAKQCLPTEELSGFQQWFCKQYPLNEPSIQVDSLSKKQEQKSFILTESRVPVYQALKGLLAVRNKTMSSQHKQHQTPGLGGLLLEGEPGTGKSHFIIDTLVNEGFQKLPLSTAMLSEEELKSKGFDLSKRFYVIPAGLSFEDKKRTLIAAFEQGVPVIIDEINSGPMLEQIVNALLNGEHPDTKKPAKHPGFLLLATQNPISMAGREKTSQAIRRRMLFHEFHAYPKAEMVEVLSKSFQNIHKKTIKRDVSDHLYAVKYAKDNFYEPIPVFRDLYNIMEVKEKSAYKNNDLNKTQKIAADIKTRKILTHKYDLKKQRLQVAANHLPIVLKHNKDKLIR